MSKLLDFLQYWYKKLWISLQQSEDDQSDPGSVPGGRRESNPSPSKPGYRRNGSLPSVFSTNGSTEAPSKLNRTPSNPQSAHSYITKKESQESSVSAHSNSSGNIYITIKLWSGGWVKSHTCKLSHINSESPCFGKIITVPPYFAISSQISLFWWKSLYFEGSSLFLMIFPFTIIGNFPEISPVETVIIQGYIFFVFPFVC